MGVSPYFHRMTSTRQLLDRIEAFLTRSGMSRTYFGRMAVGDSKLIHRLESGSTIELKTCNRVIAFIRAREKGAAK